MDHIYEFRLLFKNVKYTNDKLFNYKKFLPFLKMKKKTDDKLF